MPCITMVVGIPCSGKSTHVAAALADSKRPVLNQDSYGVPYPDCRDLFDADLRAALASGQDFIVDWTGTGKTTLEWAQRALDRGFSLEVVFVECALEEALRRVRLRNAEGGRQVPEDAIRRCHEDLWRVEALGVLAERFVRVGPETSGKRPAG
ncbi:MAG TPA: hypothetical protein DFR83_16680 [Deltaproteobacteria bacterium]|nr:hypothetical protein [Deltaproteobacteria bacterium]